MIEIINAAWIQPSVKRKISEVFVDGYSKELAFFSKSESRLVDAFEHMFIVDAFYVAMIDGEIVGITACTNDKMRPIDPKSQELISHLGYVKGSIAHFSFQRIFQKPGFVMGDRMGYIEFVATAKNHRGKGVATAMMNYLFRLPSFDEYVLEVADTNENAVKLYERLGFKEFKRIRVKWSKISGVNERIYMKREIR